MQSTGQIVRIVIDKCHTVLQSRADFRLQLQRLGELVKNRIQIVWLTAMLRPCDKEQFCNVMHTIGSNVVRIREPTTRHNIRYRVREVPHDRTQAG